MSRLIRFALAFCPAAFRREFGDQILADSLQRGDTFRTTLEIASRGVGLRIEGVFRDALFSVRTLAKTPLFTTAAIVTLAVAISVNAAVFGAINTVLLRPLPFVHPERLGFVCIAFARGGLMNCHELAPGLGERIFDMDPSVAAGAIFQALPAAIVVNGATQSVVASRVSSNFFDVMEVRPEIGRAFAAADAMPGVHRILISDRFWRLEFSADKNVLGRSIRVNGIGSQVIGVMPATFVMPSVDESNLKPQATDVFLVSPPEATPSDRASTNAATSAAFTNRVIVRLRPGTSFAAAQVQVNRAFAPILHGKPHIVDTLPIVSFVDWYSNQNDLRLALSLALAAAFVVLLIACANVASLLLSRGAARREELTLRTALGASRTRIIQQLLIEMSVLALIGGIIGVALAFVQIRVLASLLPSLLPRMTGISIDGHVVLFTFGAIVGATLVAGLLPAIFLTGQSQAANVGGRTRDPATGKLLRTALVIAEIALAFVVVVTTGLLLRSIGSIVNSAAVMNPQGVYLADINLLPSRYSSPSQRHHFAGELSQRLRRIPGIETVALSHGSPYASNGSGLPAVQLPKALAKNPLEFATGNAEVTTSVSPEYFRLFHLRMLQGRAFSESDGPGAPRVAIVGVDFAKTNLRTMNVVGQRIRLFTSSSDAVPATIVGVAGENKGLFGSPSEAIFVPIAQYPQSVLEVSMRSRIANPHLRRQLSVIVASIDPDVAIYDFYSLNDVIASASAPQRTSGTLLGLMAFVALLLALVGIYATVSFSVERRIHEFGIRKAVGALAGDLLNDVWRGAFSQTLIGIAIGIVLAAFAARTVAGILDRTGTAQFDPVAFAGGVLLLTFATLAASAVPAIRATRIDPALALRYE